MVQHFENENPTFHFNEIFSTKEKNEILKEIGDFLARCQNSQNYE